MDPLNNEKLVRLAEIEGYSDVLALLEAASTDSVVPGICVNDGCENTSEVEPDQDAMPCDDCGTDTIKSCLVIAGFI
jgi:hypothetical protein